MFVFACSLTINWIVDSVEVCVCGGEGKGTNVSSVLTYYEPSSVNPIYPIVNSLTL